MSKVERYTDLEIWQLGMEVARLIFRSTMDFPKAELYGLTSQVRRAAVSIPSNIAEGFMRRSRKEFSHFLAVAQGSIAELETQAHLAKDFGSMPPVAQGELATQLSMLGKKITRLAQSLRESGSLSTIAPSHHRTIAQD